MRRLPHRVLLPVIFCSISAGLMFWEWRHHAEWMGYDNGRPFWPCEISNALVGWLNLPAIILALPLHVFADYWNYPQHYFFLLPCIAILWWFVGTRLDFGLLGKGSRRQKKVFATGIALCTAGALLLLLDNLHSTYLWWQKWGRQEGIHWNWNDLNWSPLLGDALGSLALAAWFLLFSSAFLRAVAIIRRGEIS